MDNLGMPIPTFELRDRLRKARETVGLKQTELAGKIFISAVTLNRYERGERTAPREVVKRWAEATGVPLDWFYQEDAIEPTPQLPATLKARITWSPNKGWHISPDEETDD